MSTPTSFLLAIQAWQTGATATIIVLGVVALVMTVWLETRHFDTSEWLEDRVLPVMFAIVMIAAGGVFATLTQQGLIGLGIAASGLVASVIWVKVADRIFWEGDCNC
ncbi:MAG TPA: hypothetical protein VK694_08050 [Verrucomicrobiae bacterium]|nr:hypothetical protein [Verrucomicrobiae bacterium]